MNKVAIITGSASGIGLEIAKAFLDSNYLVVFSDINAKALEDVVKLYNKSDNCMGVVCDVGDEEQVRELIAKAYECYKRIDVFINNAGLQHVVNI